MCFLSGFSDRCKLHACFRLTDSRAHMGVLANLSEAFRVAKRKVTEGVSLF